MRAASFVIIEIAVQDPAQAGRMEDNVSGCPLGRRVRGHSEVNRTSAVMIENHEGEQELKLDGWHHEEVYGDDTGISSFRSSPWM